MRSAIATYLAMWSILCSCRGSDETRAKTMCDRANALEKKRPRAALALRRRLYEEMPTTGTRTATQCLRPIRTRMGEVRVLVSEDKRGETATVEGCAWAADVMEAFSGSLHPPFKKHWAERLMDRCATAVGRAWARAPDDPALMALHGRLVELAK